MASLQQLFKSQNMILERLLETGEETPEMIALLEQLETHLPEKVSSYKHLIDRLDAEAEYFNDKAEQYKASARALENAKTRLRDRIKFIMMEQGLSELEGTDVVFKLGKTKGIVNITNESLVPDEFKKVVTTTTFSKTGISEAILAGNVVPGAHIAESFSLRAMNKKRN